MRKFLFSLAVFAATWGYAQDLPSNPEPGKCYVRCTTPDVYINESVTVTIKPGYSVLKIIPATYKTVTERVLVKEESKKLRIIPEEWGTEKVTYVSKEGAHTLGVVPASFGTASETIEVKPAYAQWELGAAAPDCDSGNPTIAGIGVIRVTRQNFKLLKRPLWSVRRVLQRPRFPRKMRAIPRGS